MAMLGFSAMLSIGGVAFLSVFSLLEARRQTRTRTAMMDCIAYDPFDLASGTDGQV